MIIFLFVNGESLYSVNGRNKNNNNENLTELFADDQDIFTFNK